MATFNHRYNITKCLKMNNMYLKIILSYWHWTTKIIGILILINNPYFILDFFQQFKVNVLALFFFNIQLLFFFYFLMKQFTTWQQQHPRILSITDHKFCLRERLNRQNMKFPQWRQHEELSHQEQLNIAMVLMLSFTQWQAIRGIFSFMFLI